MRSSGLALGFLLALLACEGQSGTREASPPPRETLQEELLGAGSQAQVLQRLESVARVDSRIAVQDAARALEKEAAKAEFRERTWRYNALSRFLRGRVTSRQLPSSLTELASLIDSGDTVKAQRKCMYLVIFVEQQAPFASSDYETASLVFER